MVTCQTSVRVFRSHDSTGSELEHGCRASGKSGCTGAGEMVRKSREHKSLDVQGALASYCTELWVVLEDRACCVRDC
jgi:hypothetical protein